MFPRILHWYFQHFHHYKINPFSSTILDSFARTHQLLIWYNYLTKPEIEPQNLSFSLFTQSAAASFAFRPKLCLLPWGPYVRCRTHNHHPGLLWNRSSVMLSTPLFKLQLQQTNIWWSRKVVKLVRFLQCLLLLYCCTLLRFLFLCEEIKITYGFFFWIKDLFATGRRYHKYAKKTS